MTQPSGEHVPPVIEIPVIEIEDMTKTYVMGETEVHALRGVSVTIGEGEYVAIIGTSGSGKSTLMNMIGLLDKPSNGNYRIRGAETSRLSKSHTADLRNAEIGFVFQNFNLLARTSARRQVELPLFYAGTPSRKASKMAVDALTRVGLGDRTDHRPDELSGGQQQRVAIARALVNNPSLLLADEPTGALDSKTSEDVMALFKELHEQGLTLIVVTHDMEVARQAERIITLKDGRVIDDISNGRKIALTPLEQLSESIEMTPAEMTPAEMNGNGTVDSSVDATVDVAVDVAVQTMEGTE